MINKIFEILSRFTQKNEKVTENNLESILLSLKEKEILLTQNQNKLLTFLYHSTKKFKAIEAPAGTGKTICYLIYAFSKLAQFDKVVISTFTKSLQNQITSEIKKFFTQFESQTLILQGKSNYICPDKLDFFTKSYPEFVAKTDNKILKKARVSSYYCNKQYQEHCQFKNQCEFFKTFSQIDNKRVLIVNHALLPYILRNFADKQILLILDECHTLFSKKRVTFTPEDLEEILEPDPEKFQSVREYNLALESYKIKLQKKKLAERLSISSPGTYIIDQDATVDFDSVSEVLLASATLPDTFVFPDEEVDTLYLSDNRSWQNVTIEIKDINYMHPDYYNVFVNTIKQVRKKYNKVMVLCTSYQQLKFLKSKFGSEILTNLDEKPFIIAEKMKAGEINLIAGTDVFWTGIDIPGEKAIIMAKLPFPVPDGNEKDEESFITGFQQMFKKFKQGIGRMLRSPQCGGEIIILDNRVSRYPDLIAYLEELKQKSAKIVFETKIDSKKIVKPDFRKVVNY